MKMIKLKKILWPVFLLGLAGQLWANQKFQTLNWEGVPVIWVPDESLPVYTVITYFADGALSDEKSTYGITNAMFSLLSTGTSQKGQKEISEELEFYGASFASQVTHEYSTYTVSGLAKDIIPTMKNICHLFKEANFPESELQREKARALSSLEDLVQTHGALAERIFREITLTGTPYAYPVAGKKNDIPQISRENLLKHLDYFNKNVHKKIFITGPSSILAVRPIINEECGWKEKAPLYLRTVDVQKVMPKKSKTPRMTLVAVPNANQAQVRFGKFLSRHQLEDKREAMDLASTFLGGGFTSRLMRELRTKRGLTYSVSAYAAGQKEYGRAVISTFTKNETILDLIKVTTETVADVALGKIDTSDFVRSRNYLQGSYPFRFEKGTEFLGELIQLSHAERSFDELYLYQDKIKRIEITEMAKMAQELFGPEDMSIVIVGDKSLLSSLQKLGPVQLADYLDYL